MGVALWPEPITVLLEGWLEYGLQYLVQCLLKHSVHNRRNTEQAFLTVTFGTFNTSYWSYLIALPFYLVDVLRSEEHTSELQSRPHLVCRLLLEKKKRK